jgi:predicted metal-dependent hydrolase
VHHFGEGNLTGARKMYESARRYLSPYAAVHQGVLVGELLDRLRDCFAELLAVNGRYPHGVMLSPDRIPTIALQPEVPT